jgi:hypothetical protein
MAFVYLVQNIILGYGILDVLTISFVFSPSLALSSFQFRRLPLHTQLLISERNPDQDKPHHTRSQNSRHFTQLLQLYSMASENNILGLRAQIAGKLTALASTFQSS